MKDFFALVAIACVLGLVLLFGFAMVSVSHIGMTNDGSHTGYVTAVEQEGWLWKTWRAYVKTDPQSSQEDKYCVDDLSLISKLKEVAKTRELVTVNYSAPFVVWNWQCGGENSIIRDITK